MYSRNGFTLIELLLVVSILGILTAALMPKMLDARTRTEVVKVRSDMRNVGLALNSFNLTHGNYPEDRTAEFLPRLIPLTTPVAFMTSIPEDSFTKGLPPLFKPTRATPDWMKAYRINGRIEHPMPFEYMYHNRSDNWTDIAANPEAAAWALKSVGPDKLPVWFKHKMLVVYDPSNGTYSIGEIIITGPNLQADGPNR